MSKGILDSAQRLLRNFSESQLAGLLKAKRLEVKRDEVRTEIEKLTALVRRKTSQLSALEKGIRRSLSGRPSRRGRGVKGGAGTLIDALMKALARQSKPLRLTEIAKAVQSGGYKTTSAFGNFRTSVAHALRRMRDRLVRRGEGYILKPGAKAENP